MIHSPIEPAIRFSTAAAILPFLGGPRQKTTFPRIPSLVADIVSAATPTITASILVIGQHFLRGLSHVEAVGVTTGNVMNILLSTDSLTDQNALLRDTLLFGDPNVGTWLSFTTSPQFLQINRLIARYFTRYKFAHRNNSGINRVVSATLIIDT